MNIKNSETDFEKYKKLKINEVPSIKKSDLPNDFSDKAFDIVDEFIKKTIDVDYEILIYFDYTTGQILDCKIGTKTNVKLKLEEKEFKGKHVASIHNHTKKMYTPPSDKNFGIFLRKWEDYELIAGTNGLWILKGKLKDEKLTFELKIISNLLFKIALYDSKSNNNQKNIKTIEDECDKTYGKLLSNYINDKNINEIQLMKKEFNNDQNNH